MKQFHLNQIGSFLTDESGMRIVLDKQFAPALSGLAGFSHAHILWWFSDCDDSQSRQMLAEPSPYRSGPGLLGTFATRSPRRPNPIALSCVEILAVDEKSATIHIAYADAHPGTPVLDIKPYTPSLDRVEQPTTPAWCAHWPQNVESSGDFDWESELNG